MQPDIYDYMSRLKKKKAFEQDKNHRKLFLSYANLQRVTNYYPYLKNLYFYVRYSPPI